MFFRDLLSQFNRGHVGLILATAILLIGFSAVQSQASRYEKISWNSETTSVYFSEQQVSATIDALESTARQSESRVAINSSSEQTAAVDESQGQVGGVAVSFEPRGPMLTPRGP